jgi:hypothetical protein
VGLLYCRPGRICRKGSGDGHLSIGPRWGTWKGGGFYTGDFARVMKEGSRNKASLSEGAL